MHLGGTEASNSVRPLEIVGYLEIEETSRASGPYRVHGEHLITDDRLPIREALESSIAEK